MNSDVISERGSMKSEKKLNLTVLCLCASIWQKSLQLSCKSLWGALQEWKSDKMQARALQFSQIKRFRERERVLGDV